jgi:hypothetical protein
MFLTRRAHYHDSIEGFLQTPTDSVLGALFSSHEFDLKHTEKRAWQVEIQSLQVALRPLRGHIFFEFQIPRIGRRADVIILSSGAIFVLEFKAGERHFDRRAVDQVTDYALDLRHFHLASHHAPILPVLVATQAEASGTPIVLQADGIANVLCHSSESLPQLFSDLPEWGVEIHPQLWCEAAYQPTPTIVEAARALYKGHRVEDISRSDAGAINLARTAARVAELIESAKKDHSKLLCLVTGVPGAGKTLAGLNIATSRQQVDADSHAVFLSGNGPLVAVLRKALLKDHSAQQQNNIKAAGDRSTAKQRIEAFIQNIHHFRDEGLASDSAPPEKVVVFDEAQRAWNLEQTEKFMRTKRKQSGFSHSEPSFLLSVMDRHKDWCVVVCLVGGGQEINTGEAGLGEWLDAVATRFPDWRVHASPKISEPEYDWRGDLLDRLASVDVNFEPDLHLSVSIRSFRAEHLAAFVAAVVSGESERARTLFGQIPRYPLVLTRSLHRAKEWIKQSARGTERFGILASSNGIRLKPEGLFVKQPIDPAVWFLNDKEDVRSSYFLEDVATEFDVQGLELDWALVAWDANFRRDTGLWLTCDFKGTKWTRVHSDDRKRYIVNAYRVLLTRARLGMAIFVPPGNPDDRTAHPKFYDETFAFLRECGIPELD